MRTSKVIHVVSCHAEGEVGDVIVGGVAPPPGETIWEQSRFIARDETLRNFVLNEPRGGVFRHVNLLVPPKDPRAQMGWIIMEPADTPPMSGSNSICVATVLLDTGIIPMQEPETRLTLEAPGGLVEVTAACRDGKAERITVRNVPSFADRLDAKLEVEGVGTLTVDTAYGGDSFVIVDATALGFAIRPDEAQGSGGDRHEDHPSGQRADRLQASRASGMGSHLLLPDRGAARRPGRRSARRQRRGGAPWQDRPLADRHRLLGPHGGASRARHAEGRRPLRRALDHRLGVQLPHRGRGDGGRQARHHPVDLRTRLDHRHPSAHARSRRSVAGRLPAVGYLAADVDLSRPLFESLRHERTWTNE